MEIIFGRFRSFWHDHLFVRVMAQIDRWTFKILSLPVFDEAFSDAIAKTPLANPTFVIALGARSQSDFTAKVGAIAETFVEDVSNIFLQKTVMLEQFWSLVVSSEKLFLESSTQQLGFGLCEHREPPKRDLPLEDLKREAAIRALVARPTAPKKRLKPDPDQSSSNPLLDKENAEKARWAARLEAIGRRAGAAAKLLTLDDQSDDLSGSEMLKLRQLVLNSGAPRTMAIHIRSFERYELWASMYSLDPFPLHVDKILIRESAALRSFRL